MKFVRGNRLFGCALVILCATGILLPVVTGDSLRIATLNPRRLQVFAVCVPAALSAVCILSFFQHVRFRFTSTDGWTAAFAGYWFFRYFGTGCNSPTLAFILILSTGIYVSVRAAVSVESRSRAVILFFLCLTGITEAIWGLGQLFGYLPSYHSRYPFTGSLFNPGPYSGMLACLLPLALELSLRKPSRSGEQWLYYAGTGCAAASAILLPAGMSRSAWLAALCGSGLVLWRHSSLTHAIGDFFRKKKRRLIPAVVIGLLLAGGSIAGMYTLKKDSADGRLLMWKVSGIALKEAPFTGQGPGSFAGAYGKAQSRYFSGGKHSPQEEYVAGSPEYGFNEYLQITAELGTVGLLLFAGMVLSALRQAYRHRQTGIAGSLLAFAVFAFFSYPFSVLPLVILFAVFTALCSPPSATGTEPVFRAALVLFAAGCLYAGCGLREKAQWLYAWKEEKRYFDMGIYEGTTEEYRKFYPALKEFFPFLFEYGQCLAKTGRYGESISVLREGAARSADPMFYNIIGRNEQALGNYEAAEAAFRQAYNMVPHRLYPLYLLAELYVSTGQYEKAAGIIRKALAQKPKIMSPAIEEMQHKLKELYEQLPS